MVALAPRRRFHPAGLIRPLLGLLFGLLLLAPGLARADNPVLQKRGVFREQGDQLTLTVGFRELFSPAMRRRLRSGFATRVVMRVYLFEQSGARNVAFSARTVKAVYDLWEEHFNMRIEEPKRTVRRRFKKRRKVVDRLTSLWRFPVAKLSEVKPGKKYFVAIIAEVNPIRESLLAEVRSWLRNPRRAQSSMGGESLFGSFVSIFVNNKIRRAEKTARVRTQPFYRRP